MNLSDYKNGNLIVRDKITGFKGTVTGHADYITGCDQYLVQPESKDGDWKEGRWFDGNRLEVSEKVKPVFFNTNGLNDNGADTPAPLK